MVEHPRLEVAMLSVHSCPLATLGGKKTGGMNVYVRELAIELGKRDICVDIFTVLQEQCQTHLSTTRLGVNAQVIHIAPRSGQPAHNYELLTSIPDFVGSIEKYAAQKGRHYDLIHSHYWLSGLAAHQLSQHWNIPFIHMFHTLGRMKNRVAQDPMTQEPEDRIQAEQGIVKVANQLIAATPAERIQLLWLYGADMRRIKVIPPGVDTAHFRPIPQAQARAAIGIPVDAQMLLFVGRIEPLKGIEVLLRAIALLRDQAPTQVSRLCISIIGGEPDQVNTEDVELRRLKNLRADLGLEDVVTFLGAKDQDTLHYYYSAAEAVIMPSYYESFGMVALESMACGTPVIASEVGGLAYLIQDGITGFHVPDRSPDELAGRIRLLLENPTLRGEMAAAAIQNAQEYAWPRIATQIESTYAGLLGK